MSQNRHLLNFVWKQIFPLDANLSNAENTTIPTLDLSNSQKKHSALFAIMIAQIVNSTKRRNTIQSIWFISKYYNGACQCLKIVILKFFSKTNFKIRRKPFDCRKHDDSNFGFVEFPEKTFRAFGYNDWTNWLFHKKTEHYTKYMIYNKIL